MIFHPDLGRNTNLCFRVNAYHSLVPRKFMQLSPWPPVEAFVKLIPVAFTSEDKAQIQKVNWITHIFFSLVSSISSNFSSKFMQNMQQA